MTLVLYFSPVTLVGFCLALVPFGTGALILCYNCKGRSGASAMIIRQHVIRWGSTYDAYVLLTLAWPLSVYV